MLAFADIVLPYPAAKICYILLYWISLAAEAHVIFLILNFGIHLRVHLRDATHSAPKNFAVNVPYLRNNAK